MTDVVAGERQNAAKAMEIDESANWKPGELSIFAEFDYPCLEDDFDGAAVQDQISEADLRRATEQVTRIQWVVVLTIASTGNFVPFIRLSDRTGYSRMATRKYKGAKAHLDFKTMQKQVTEHGFSDSPQLVYPDSHAYLKRLGIKG